MCSKQGPKGMRVLLMGYRVAGAGSRFEGSTRHSMVVRDCPLCRWDGGTAGGVRRNEAVGVGRRQVEK